MINVKIAACLVSTHKAIYGCISKKKKVSNKKMIQLNFTPDGRISWCWVSKTRVNFWVVGSPYDWPFSLTG